MRLLVTLARQYPARTSLTLFALILSGTVEGIGLSALFPMLNQLQQTGAQPEAPEWLEKLPEIPNLSVEALENIKILAEAAPSIQASHEAMLKNHKRSWLKPVLKVIAITCFVGAFVSFFNSDQELNWLTVTFIITGLTALLSI